jgi:S-formylglutathione hydrolase FrmB
MKRFVRPGLVLLALLGLAPASPAWSPFPPLRLPRLAGTLVDYTHHHGADHRFWSPVLGQWRDMYVYLPPGYNPASRYPLLLWLHGIAEDEGCFVSTSLRAFDAAIAAGQLPPLIIAMPDGSWQGRPRLLGSRPLYLNSNLGNFEDFIVQDVLGFVASRFSLRPEREAHVIAGMSGGGGAAYRIALRYPALFGIVIGLSPPLNIRWVDCHGDPFGNFDPSCWGWRNTIRGKEVVCKYYLGLVKVRMGSLVYPLFGHNEQDILAGLSRENPIEMLDQFDVQPGAYRMFVAYGGSDQFNIDAQVESFLYRARQRGLCVDVAYDPHGRHSLTRAGRFIPRVIDWLGPLLEPYRCETMSSGRNVQSGTVMVSFPLIVPRANLVRSEVWSERK